MNPGSPPPQDPISLLLIDDDEAVLDSISEYLVYFFHFTVTKEVSGEAALETLSRNTFDAIVSDYEMKGMTGIEFLKRLRSRGDDTPVIIFTGRGREEVVIESYENGADAYIQKGGDVRSQYADLVKKIQTVVEKKVVERNLKASESYLIQLNNLKARLLSPQTLEQKLRRITDGLVSIFGADYAGIWVMKEADCSMEECMPAPSTAGTESCTCQGQSSCLHQVASSGNITGIRDAYHRIPPGESRIGMLFSGMEHSYITGDIHDDPEISCLEQLKSAGITSFAGFRLFSSGEHVTGVLALFRKNPVVPLEVEFLEDIANTASQVLITGAAEQARDASEEFLENIIENIPDMIIVKDLRDLRYIRFNHAGEELLGFKREEIIGKQDREIFPREDVERIARDDEVIRGSPAILDIPEEPVYSMTKGARILHTKKVPLFTKTGKIAYLLGISEDITEQIQVREDRDRLRKYLEKLLRLTRTEIDILDDEFRLVYVDPERQKRYGDFKGKRCYEYFRRRRDPCSFCAVHEALERKETIIREERGEPEGGRTMEVHTVPFREKDGRWYIAEFILDITERKKSDERMYEYFRGLEQISRGTIRMLESEEDSGVYHIIGSLIRDLVPPGTVVITCEVDTSGKAITTRSIQGMEPVHREILGDFVNPLQKIVYPVSYASWEYLVSGKMEEIVTGLRTLTEYVFPESVYERIEKSGVVGKIYEIGISWKKSLQGSVVLVLPLGTDIVNRSLIEMSIQIAAIELQRRKTASLLREERGLFVGGPVVIFRWEPTEGWPVQYVSPNVLDQLGYFPDELISGPISVFDLIHPDDLERIQEETYRFIEEGRLNFNQEYRVKRRDGVYHWVNDFTVVNRDKSGAISSFQGYAIDIHDRKLSEKLLRETEENARVLINAPKDSILMIEPEGSILYINTTAASRFGFEPDQMIGRNLNEFLPDEIQEKRRPYLDQAIKTGDVIQFYDERDGRTYDNNLYPVKNERGVVTRIAIYGRDVTEKLESEKQLARSELKYRELVQNANSIILRFDKNGRVVFFNEFGQDFFGFTQGDVNDRGIGGMICQGNGCPDSDREPAVNGILAHPDRYLHHENQITCKDGRKVWISWTNRPIYEDGVFSGILSVGTDITKRKNAEEALKQREQFLSNIFTSIQDGICILDMEMRILRVNATMERWYEHARPLVGRICHEVFIGSPERCRQCPSSVTLATGESAREIVPRLGRNQKIEGWIELYSFPLVDMSTGEMSGVIEYARDITDKLLAEKALKQANLKLNLLSSITRHDVLNQITALSMFQQLSWEMMKDDSLRTYLEKEITITKAIQSQIDFTKDYQDIGITSPSWQDVSEVIGKARRTLDLSGIHLVCTITGLLVLADPLFIKVFYTLMENGTRHGERITTISWSASGTTGGYLIIYEDDGIGVLDIDKDRIFIRGVGAHTGLGLFLSREILAITGMTIRESGRYGEGARFEIFVPDGSYRLQNEDG